jgi:hypothetical protein
MDPITKNLKSIIIVGGFFFVSLVAYLIINTMEARKKEVEFINREMSGVLNGVKDLSRGTYTLIIRQHQTNRIFEYDLNIGKFIKENDIKVNDSLSKASNNGVITFYKKNGRGIYEKCCLIEYY